MFNVPPEKKTAEGRRNRTSTQRKINNMLSENEIILFLEY